MAAVVPEQLESELPAVADGELNEDGKFWMVRIHVSSDMSHL